MGSGISTINNNVSVPETENGSKHESTVSNTQGLSPWLIVGGIVGTIIILSILSKVMRYCSQGKKGREKGFSEELKEIVSPADNYEEVRPRTEEEIELLKEIAHQEMMKRVEPTAPLYPKLEMVNVGCQTMK